MSHQIPPDTSTAPAIANLVELWSRQTLDSARGQALSLTMQGWRDALERLQAHVPAGVGQPSYVDALSSHAVTGGDDGIEALNAQTSSAEPDWWEQRQRVLRGQDSLQELTERALDRLEQLNQTGRVCVASHGQEGLAQARLLDKQLAAGTLLPPLAGMPSAHKDLLFRTNAPVSCGLAAPATFAGGQLSDALRTLHSQGILDLGQLHLTELALDPSGLNDSLGLCPNPWSLAHAPGGSSSGSGVAVGARAVFGALGSDTAGSIRVPAMLCGVTGLKPTYGTLPTRGAMTLSHTHDHLGPMATSARDCALMMAPFLGKQATPELPRLGLRTKGLRMGVPQRFFHEALQGKAKALIDASLRDFESLGVTLVQVPDFDYEAINAIGSLITRSEACAGYSQFLQPDSTLAIGPLTRARLIEGMAGPAFAYARALALRAPVLNLYMSQVMANVDVLHAPVAPIAAPRFDQVRDGAPNQAGTLDSLIRMTRPFNYLGLPALALPCGHIDTDGVNLPFGFQLVGKPGADWQLLKLANAYQAVTDWHTHAPSQAG